MMWIKRISLLCGLSLLMTAAGGLAQTADSLKGAFGREAQLLDEAIEDYGRSRTYESSSVGNLRQLSEQIDEALGDPNASLDYLTNLEAQLAAARDSPRVGP